MRDVTASVGIRNGVQARNRVEVQQIVIGLLDRVPRAAGGAAGPAERTRLVSIDFASLCRQHFGTPGRPDLLFPAPPPASRGNPDRCGGPEPGRHCRVSQIT